MMTIDSSYEKMTWLQYQNVSEQDAKSPNKWDSNIFKQTSETGVPWEPKARIS